MKYLIFSLVILFTNVYTQSDIPISTYLNEVAKGNSDKIKLILPDLMVEYPNDAGVKFLTAAVLSDAMRALDVYNQIVEEHPQSEWADDALYRIIQFDVVLGNNENALNNLNKLRQRYPASEYIIPSADLVNTAFSVKENLKGQNYANINENADENLLKKAQDEEKESDITIIPKKDNKQNEVKQSGSINLSMNDNLEDFTPEPMNGLKKVIPVESDVKKPIEVAKVDDDEKDSEEDNEVDIVYENGKDDVKTDAKKLDKQDKAEELKNILNKQMELEKAASKNEKTTKTNENRNDIAFNNTIDNSEKTEQIKKSETDKRWGLQVAVFESKDAAEKEKEKFIAQRMRTEVVTRMIDNKPMYAVVVGKYSTKSNAEAAKIIINQQCNCNPLILER